MMRAICAGRANPARFLVILTAVLTATALAVSGCGGDPDPGHKPAALSGQRLAGDFTGAGQTPGALASASTLPTIDRRLRAETSLAARIEFTSTSGVTLATHQVTGSVFVPKGKPPEAGWPIVAYGHATTGIQPDCGPSLSPTLLGSAPAVMALVKAGFVVTMPDYQGLGLEGTYHPFLDSTTAGYNIIDSVRAARKLVPAASDQWVALGISQGGQAVWAANELAANYGGGLRLLGTASLAPPADINAFADAAALGQLTKEQQPVMQMILASLKNEYTDFPLDDYRRGIVKDKWDVLSACRGPAAAERSNVTAQITPDDLRPSSPEAVANLAGFLKKMSLPQAPAAAPMLVAYGGMDALIPAAWTERALLAACGMGDVIDIYSQPDKGHSDIDPSTAVGWITERFKGVPAPNSCVSFAAAFGFGEGTAAGEGE
jgi:hypothetical protein